MDLLTALIGAAAFAVLVFFSVLATRVQNAALTKCSRLDECQSREMEIAMRKVRSR